MWRVGSVLAVFLVLGVCASFFAPASETVAVTGQYSAYPYLSDSNTYPLSAVTTQTSVSTRTPTIYTDKSIDERFVGMLLHVRWLLNEQASTQTEQELVRLNKQILSVMDDIGEDRSDNSGGASLPDGFEVNDQGQVTVGTWQAGVIADTYISDILTIGTSSIFANNIITPNSILATGQTDEYCLTYEGTGNTFEWETCGSGTGMTATDIDTSAELATILTDETGTGATVFATSPILTTPNLGTPSMLTLTNATGLPISTGISGLGAGVATFLGTPSSANFASSLTNETGTGNVVFSVSPTMTGTIDAVSANFSGNVRVGASSLLARLSIDNTVSSFGGELVTNGSFTGSAAGWTLGDCASYGTNNVIVTYTTCSNANVETDFTTVAGEVYNITFTISAVINEQVQIYTFGNGLSHEYGPFGAGTHTISFPTDFTGTETIVFESWNYSSGGSWTIDDVSIRSIASGQSSFAIRGFNGSSELMLSNSTANIALGLGALNSVTSGVQNVAIGRSAGSAGTFFSNNIFVGYRAGELSTGSENLFIGTRAGAFTTGGSNVFLGNESGTFSSGSSQSTFTGSGSGYYSTGAFNAYFGHLAGFGQSTLSTGNYNSFFGSSAGRSNTGSNNSFFGADTGYNNTSGSRNVFIGGGAGFNNATSSRNVIIGDGAGYSLQSSFNTIVGFGAGSNITTGGNNLILGNNSTFAPSATASNQLNIGNIIFGTSINGYQNVLSTGNIGIGTTSPSSKLTVSGDLRVTGAFRDTSGDAGTNGQVLLSTLTGTNWTSTSSLGISGGLTSADIDTSNELNTIVSDNTGSGALVFATAPTFTTSITSPLIYGGTAASSQLILRSTSGTGTIDDIIMGIGTNGATQAFRIDNENDSVMLGENAGATFNSLTLGNVALGHEAGRYASTSNSDYSIYIGNEAGRSNSGYYGNIFIGDYAGREFSLGGETIALGSEAARYSQGYDNNVMGSNAAKYNTGSNNNFFGRGAGEYNTGSGLNLIGTGAGQNNTGSNNNILGSSAGLANIGSNNNLLGVQAGNNNSGDYSNFIGWQAGNDNTGNNNNFFGYAAGYDNTGSNNNFFGSYAGEKVTNNNVIAIGLEAGRYASTTFAASSTYIGYQAGYNNTQYLNDIIGYQAGYNNTGSDNNIMGYWTGYNNTGDVNVILGYQAGYNNTNGDYNVMAGYNAGYTNSGDNNVLMGVSAGTLNTGGGNNIFGSFAGGSNSGDENNLFGSDAGGNNTGTYNNIFGYSAGYGNDGDHNNIFGYEAGFRSEGNQNQFMGHQAGRFISSTSTVAIGGQVLRGTANFDAVNNVALGYRAGYAAQTGADNNILLGYQAADNLTTGNNNIIIGYDIDNVTATADNRLNIGNLIFGTGLDGTGTTLASGNIGIGTTTPGAKLDVNGTIRSMGLGNPTFGSGVETAFWSGAGYIGSANRSNNTNVSTNIFGSTIRLGIGTLAGEVGDSLVITSNGNVALGENAASQKLDVNGTNAQLLVEESITEFLRTGVGETANTSVIGWDDSDSLRLGVYDSPTDTTISDLMTILSSGNVGIGDTTPDYLFDVAGTAGFDGLLTMTGTAANIALGLNYLSGDGGDEGVYVDASGNVSVGGDTAPDGKFDVELTSTNATAAYEYGMHLNINDTGVVTTGVDQTTGSLINLVRSGTTGGVIYNVAQDIIVNGTFASGVGTLANYGSQISVTGSTAGASTNYGLSVTVSGADTNYAATFMGGDVGIGTASPAHKLSVVTSGVGYIAQFTDGTRDLRFFTSSGYGALGSERVGDDLRLYVDGNATRGLTVQNGTGNVGIGTTTPAQRLQVFGNIRVGTSGSNGCIENYAGGVIGGTCSSDQDLKTNIEPLAVEGRSYIEGLAALTPVSYNWNMAAVELYRKDKNAINLGLIAQDVEAQFPELVSKNDDGFKQVDFGALPFYIIEALKELWAKVQGQDERLLELEQENEYLKDRIENIEDELNLDAPPPPPEPTQQPEPTPEPLPEAELEPTIEPPAEEIVEEPVMEEEPTYTLVPAAVPSQE